MMPLERTGAFTLACSANLLVVALAMVFLSRADGVCSIDSLTKSAGGFW